MKLTLRHRLPLVLGAAVVLTGASGAAAFALVAAHSDDPGTGTGNSLPIDDNHSSPTTATKPGDDNGVDATTEPAEQETHAPRPAAPTRVRESEPADDHGHSAEPEPTETHRGSDDGSGHDGSGGGGSDDSGGHGSDG